MFVLFSGLDIILAQSSIARHLEKASNFNNGPIQYTLLLLIVCDASDEWLGLLYIDAAASNQTSKNSTAMLVPKPIAEFSIEITFACDNIIYSSNDNDKNDYKLNDEQLGW